MTTGTVEAAEKKPKGKRIDKWARQAKKEITKIRSRHCSTQIKDKSPAGLTEQAMWVFTSMSQITDSLFLCGLRGLSVDNLKRNGITLVINVTHDLINEIVPGIKYKRYEVADEPNQDIKQYFHPAADSINEEIRTGGKVAVHCLAGVSRSCSIVLAYLVKYHGMTLHDAFMFVRKRRSVVRPNYGFFQQLIAFEKEVHSSREPSVKMIKLGDAPGDLIPDIYEEECKGFLWLRSVKDRLKDDKK